MGSPCRPPAPPPSPPQKLTMGRRLIAVVNVTGEHRRAKPPDDTAVTTPSPIDWSNPDTIRIRIRPNIR